MDPGSPQLSLQTLKGVLKAPLVPRVLQSIRPPCAVVRTLSWPRYRGWK